MSAASLSRTREVASTGDSRDAIFVLGRARHAPPRSTPYAIPVHYVASGKPEREHPCSRPIGAVHHILRDWFRPGDVICDPFAGSDTTGWAARRLGIGCYSFEIDPRIYQIAEARHAQQDLFLTESRARRVQEGA